MKSLILMLCLLLAEGSTLGQEKTAFQTGSAWRPEIDVRSDIAIVYGARDHKNMSFEDRVESWRAHGYKTFFMTGIAWGEYQDYFFGKWDGKNHQDIGQVEQNGKVIWHEGGIPYIVPEKSFLEYMKTSIVKRVIDAGITSIFLEEPEFWARAGYSEVFKKEWKEFYGFDWRPQHESAENTYLSQKLKYHLYYTAIKAVSEYAKAYGKSKGLAVKVYIATHSLVNYSAWKIVSPEASLAALPGIDGYIAQVWTGTSREATYYQGKKKERVFENAFLEYGSMVSMTAPTGRKMFFLTDPIEDRPKDWGDYKRNYQATFVAKLLYPTVNNYEVMPWPERIYTRPYKLANTNQEVLIPKYYSTQMQVMVNALNDMPSTDNQVSGVGDIGVLMGNSLMFQQFPTHQGYEDPQFSNFYGQTLPLLKNGVPVQTVHMENLKFPATLKHIKVLVMSYSNMKPFAAEVNEHLAEWVKAGGVLVYCGSDDDPYQSVLEWWNSGGRHFKTPAAHLFGLMDVQLGQKRTPYGKGAVYVIRKDPKHFVLNKGGDSEFLDILKQAYEGDAKGGKLVFKNYLYLSRGPYQVISVMDENEDKQPYVLKGPMLDLFNPALPVLQEKVVTPGEQALVYSLSHVKSSGRPFVLAAASRIYEVEFSKKKYSFVCKSPLNTINSMRVWLPGEPKKIEVLDVDKQPVLEYKHSWDRLSGTLYLGFDNNPGGITVNLGW